MDEDSILTNPGQRKRSLSLYLWWGLNIAIVVFVFLAFLMSTLSYAHSKEFAQQVNNSFITQQGGLVQMTYKVAPNFQVRRGTVASFCGRDNSEVCEGLGPIWEIPFSATDSWSPAIQAAVAQITPTLAAYVHVAEADHNTLRISAIATNNQPGVKKTTSLGFLHPVVSIHVHATSNPSVIAVMYTTNNITYLHAASVSTDQTTITLSPNPIPLFGIHNPENNETLVRNLAVAGDWILVTYGFNYQGAAYRAFVVNQNSNTLISELSIANGYIVQGTANHVALGHIDFAGLNINSIQSSDFFVHFRTLHITQLYGDLLLFSGVQVEFVDEPLVLSMLVNWNTTALRLNIPTNLLDTQNHRLVEDQLSVCYLPPTTQEPYGGVFFTYVDGQSRRAKILRARPVFSGEEAHLLPSPSLDISSHPYGRYGSWLAPHLSCPIATSDKHMLIVIQDFLSSFNIFSWAGGYRYAGVVQDYAIAGAEVLVVRQGISSGNNNLVPGYHYYVYNDGRIGPSTSIAELFTPNGFPWLVGTAIAGSKLHLEGDVFDTPWAG